jgi:hypothetical protein
VAVVEQLIGPGRPDYADAFEIRPAAHDPRTAEQWLRAGLEQSPAALRRAILVVHRRVLRLRLGPLEAVDHVLGWRITADEPDVVRLEASGPLADAVIVGRRTATGSTLLTTALRYRHAAAARMIWACAGPLHRRVAPYLLARAAQGATTR